MYIIKKNIFLLLKTFDFFYSNKKALIILFYLGRLFMFKFPSFYFVKNKQNKNLSFLFIKRFHFVTFLKHFINFYARLFSFYFFRLKLKGLGFRLKFLSKKIIRFYFNSNNFFYFYLPNSIIIKYKTRKLFFISSNLENLRVVIVHLLLLKKLVIYRVRGLLFPRQIILMKPGKKRF